jgi:hypothetical protein
MSMSATDPSVPQFNLVLDSGNPTAEVFLLDHQLRLVARGIGQLETRAPSGVYRAKVVLGRQSEERSILLDQDRHEWLGAPEIASPAPLVGTSHTHEHHVDGAYTESSKIHFVHGDGATIFLFARRWTDGPHRSISTREYVHPGRGLSLREPGGRIIADLERHGAVSPGWDGWAALTVAVDPGAYLLHYQPERGIAIEQTLCAVEGWQTQAFFLRTQDLRSDEPSPTRAAEFANISILMSSSGFDPNRGDMRLAEVGRLALADERPILSQELSGLLSGKFDNPMLGLFGAHLLLLARDRASAREDRWTQGRQVQATENYDEQSLQTAVDNLRGILGPGHPDVVALALRLGDTPAEAVGPFRVPPMLRRSWSILVEASNERPDLIDPRMWRRISSITAGRPFLSWIRRRGRGAAEAENQLAEALQARLALAEVDVTALDEADDISAELGPLRGASPAAADQDARDEILRDASVEMGIPRFVVDEVVNLRRSV